MCKVLQKSAAALHKPRASGIGDGLLEATVYKGRAFENRRFAEFSFSESLAPGELLACSRNGINMAESPGVLGFQAVKSISPVSSGDTTDSDDLNRTKAAFRGRPLTADSVEKVGFGFHGRKVRV